jgi:hypothetical protein
MEEIRSMDATAILQPVLAMALLTTAMAVWMYATRIPAMQKAGFDPNDARDKSALDTLPASARWPADNYNHLFEQPTLFYAVALSIAVLGHVDSVHVACAWVFTGARIAHSLVQATVNIIMLRFSIFAISWVALAVMVVREALNVF